VQQAPTTSPGSGGDGAFILAAPGGIFFSGKINLGRGGGIVYGDFHDTGTIVGAPLDSPYSQWTATNPSDFYLVAGTGGGGAGGDGQLVVQTSQASTMLTTSVDPSLLIALSVDQGPAPGAVAQLSPGLVPAGQQPTPLNLPGAKPGQTSVQPPESVVFAEASLAPAGTDRDNEALAAASDAFFTDLVSGR
jgi:hypothetical protein